MPRARNFRITFGSGFVIDQQTGTTEKRTMPDGFKIANVL